MIWVLTPLRSQKGGWDADYTIGAARWYARSAGCAPEARVPGLGEDIANGLDTLWLKGGDVQATLQKIGENANAKIAASKPK